MDSTDKDLRKTNNIEQMAIIGKMHNLQWLKSNSQLSGHTKTIPVGKELVNNPHESKINEETKKIIKVVSTVSISNSPELQKNDLIRNKNLDDSSTNINKTTHHPTLIVGFSESERQENSMENTWNKDANVISTLISNSQSVAMKKVNEQEKTSTNLAENIVTVQLEQFRLNEEKISKPNKSYNEPNSEWSTVPHNIPDSSKLDSNIGSQVSLKQCHDNNNNNAKSKTQPTSEVKKSIQRPTTKISAKKLSDQKIKKQIGNSLKEPCTILKHGNKDKDDLLNSCSSDNKTSASVTNSKKIALGIGSKFIDKCGKVDGYNRQLIGGKRPQTKEQQFYKQHFSMLNDSSSRNKSFVERLDEKNKFLTTNMTSSRNESDKKDSEINDTKKCHRVQVIRSQSYNVQYNRNKSLINSQQRYLRNSTKSVEENSVKNISGSNNNISIPDSSENVSKKKCENQQNVASKQVNNVQTNQGTSGKNLDNFNVPESGINDKTLQKSTRSISSKRSYQNLSHLKTTTDRYMTDDQGYTQKFKKDSNVYRRSSDILQPSFKDLNEKEKADDHKKNITDNNSGKDYKINRTCSVDTNMRSQDSKITIYPNKTVNGANNINKTDTSDSSAVNIVQSIKSLSSCSNSTKDSTTINTSTHTSQEPQVLQVSCNGTEVQFAKTEQDASNNNSNNKTSASNSETKSVKFSDNVQEMNVAIHPTTSYTDNSIQQDIIPTNSFYSNLQFPFNAQEMENHQNVQNKSYFHNNNAQYSNTTGNIQNSERDLYLVDAIQHKSDQTSHVSPQNISPHNNCNPAISIGNGSPYQNLSPVYLNQYSNMQTIPRKTPDSTIVSHNALIPNNFYTVANQNMLQNESSNVLMHNTQTSSQPSPGFHNHPATNQHNQWNVPVLDMLLFGNMMNSTHPLNMQVQNCRHVCSTDFNNIPQTGYLQHPLFYVPPECMQSWNPLIQYPAPLFQNTPYTNCNAYPNQVLPSNTLSDSINCPVNVSGNMQGCKSSNVRMKENAMDVHTKNNRYRGSATNEYQNCSQNGQVMVPISYAVTMDPVARNGPSNMHMQVNQKYTPHAATAVNYQRMPDTCSAFQNNQDFGNRKYNVSKNDPECIPPMVSPRECMYYGVNYSRKIDTIQNPSLRSNVKPVSYMHSGNSQHYHAPQFHKNATYHHASPKELTSRATVSRGVRRTIDQ
ncbi:uncharacterized protein LOC143343294 isoform X1 [Colletes latitarsis]|uniref:uncharacterized protein LOC143343294 isoform X1 n=2 Tax=Colletes latitarsis TaxID=2605962 RepID=UPI00403733A9